MKALLIAVALAVVAAMIGWQGLSASPQGIALSRVSVGNEEQQANNRSLLAFPSNTGRYVAFTSFANNLVAGDTNNVPDVFLRDTVSQTTIRISRNTVGNNANDTSVAKGISPNGRYIIFDSSATNIVVGDTNGQSDGFLYDRVNDTTVRVTLGLLGVEGNDFSTVTAVSPDGRWVAFTSAADNLVAGDTNNMTDCFLRDLNSNATLRVVPLGVPNPTGPCTAIDVSDDGRYVAFESWAPDLVPGDTNAEPDIFIMDLNTNDVRRVSVDSVGNQANDASFAPELVRTTNGFLVAYRSLASNLFPGDSNGSWDIFIYDVATGDTELGSLSTSSNLGNNDSWEPSLSEDGNYLVFFSDASNLVPNDTNNVADVFLRDRSLGITVRLSLNASGVQGNNESNYGVISSSGEAIAYTSLASNLVADDTNFVEDVFLLDSEPPTATTTRTPTPSLTPTLTAIPPTHSPTVTATGTALPPTLTPTGTLPPESTTTPTPSPTPTEEPLPTLTPTATEVPPTQSPTATPTGTFVPPTVTVTGTPSDPNPTTTATPTLSAPTLTATVEMPTLTATLPPSPAFSLYLPLIRVD